MARRIEIWPTDRLVPYAKNARTHSPEQVAQIAASIAEFGFNAPILVDSKAGIIAGHGRLLAARKLGLDEVPVVVLDHLSETQRRAYIIADNKLALNAGWDEKVLAAELHDLESDGVDLALVGFSDEELEDLLVNDDPQSAPEAEEEIPEAPANPVTRPGDLWTIGPHHLICGDCRDITVVLKLLDDVRPNVCITSPPYATQREYDSTSGFKPVPPDEYVAWYKDVAANIQSVLADDGSYFLNIKEHADEGERNLYVKDLVVAHRRAWAWRFVDEFCWRKTDNGVPGGWNNRFKNAWEPVFHFCRQQTIKFRPKRVGHESENCFDYSPNNPKSKSGSGLLGILTGDQTKTGLTEDDDAPEPQEQAITVRGDVWVMGNHRLLCGDATVLADVEKVLAGGLADMVFTDPPYGVAYQGKTAKKLKIANDALGGRFHEFLRDACANMITVCKGAIYVCMSSSELHTLYQAFTDAGGHWSTFVIWAKHHFTLGRSDYQRQYEPILYGWRKGVNHFWCGDRDQGDVWFIKRPMANLEHPTMKPVELVERALRNNSKSRDTILDPFGGSGTTIIACEKTGRQARVIELDPKYCDVIVRRWEAFTGQCASRGEFQSGHTS
jgi:DNA modification methylase